MAKDYIGRDGRVAGPLKTADNHIINIDGQTSLSFSPSYSIEGGKVVFGKHAIPTIETIIGLILDENIGNEYLVGLIHRAFFGNQWDLISYVGEPGLIERIENLENEIKEPLIIQSRGAYVPNYTPDPYTEES